jgi:hypothetical protein
LGVVVADLDPALERWGLADPALGEPLVVGGDVGGISTTCITGGTFNAAYRLRLADGSGAVLKIAPGPTGAILGYEQGILRTEARFYQQARQPC